MQGITDCVIFHNHLKGLCCGVTLRHPLAARCQRLPFPCRHSEKILKSRRLEEIRLTILNNLLLFHPESGQELAWGIRARKADNSIDVPLGARSQ